MKAWGDLPGDDPERDRAEKEAAIEAAGIDLDPIPPGSHRHGDETHPSDHAHPHAALGARRAAGHRDRRRRRGRDGAGRRPDAAPAGRSTRSPAATPAAASGSARWSTSTRVFADPEPILDEVELIILAVPTTPIAPLAGSLRMYSGQAMIHTSGALGAEVLAPAMAAGTQIGAFHPLVAFADTERAVAALHGATVAIEGDDQLAAMLADMAEAIGRDPGPPGTRVEGGLPRGRRPRRGRLRRAARRDRRARPGGRTRRGRVARDLRPARSRARSATPARSAIRAALTGPMTRGDVGTLRAHLDTLRTARARASLDLYVAAAGREVASGRGAGRPGTGGRDEDARRARRRPCKPGPNRYHSLPWITASRPSTRPARRPDSSAPRRASGSADWASARPARSRRPALRTTTLHGPEVAPLARLRASWRAIQPAVVAATRPAVVPRPLVTMEWARSGRPGTVRRPGAASAPWPA